jgi:metallo-beta-lactamase family protein
VAGQLTFYGGAGGVTGSKHLLKVGRQQLLFDCGLFQGLADVRERNRSVPFRPESISHIVISHAHIDHIGMLPVLVRRGFRGRIYATPATTDLASYMLSDMAAIELQDVEYRKKHHVGSPGDREPLFLEEDVAPTMECFVPVPYVRETNNWFEIEQGFRLKFYDAGHILGSAVSVVEAGTGSDRQTIAYTGDLGPTDWPLLRDPEVPKETVATVLAESTYGSRRHLPLEQALGRLAADITRIAERGGKIIIPAFALGRTQGLVYLLHRMTDEQHIPRLPMYVDSPLATRLTQVFQRHPEDYDEETANFMRGGHPPLAFRNLRYTQSVEESKALNTTPGPFILVSSSGMMTAGRVIHHLRHCISDSRNAILITGYQAAGTLGRQLLEGVAAVELYGENFPVKAEVLLYNEFSAHADRTQLRSYIEQIRGVERVVLVHGEPHQADDLKEELTKAHPRWRVHRPNEGDTLHW